MIALLGWLSPRDLDQYPAEASEFQVAAAALPEDDASARTCAIEQRPLTLEKFGDVRQKAEPE
jgi:hypothetical protein